jgi:hypothetical protein
MENESSGKIIRHAVTKEIKVFFILAVLVLIVAIMSNNGNYWSTSGVLFIIAGVLLYSRGSYMVNSPDKFLAEMNASHVE